MQDSLRSGALAFASVTGWCECLREVATSVVAAGAGSAGVGSAVMFDLFDMGNHLLEAG